MLDKKGGGTKERHMFRGLNLNILYVWHIIREKKVHSETGLTPNEANKKPHNELHACLHLQIDAKKS